MLRRRKGADDVAEGQELIGNELPRPRTSSSAHMHRTRAKAPQTVDAPRDGGVSVASLVTTYAAIGASRNSFVAITGLMVADPALGITPAVVADVLATGTLVYTAGKLSAGAFLDSAVTTTHAAASVTLLSNLGVALSIAGMAFIPLASGASTDSLSGLSPAQSLLWLWIVNRICQVVGWPCIAKIVAWTIPEEKQGGAWGWLSASSHIGRMLGTVVVAAAVGLAPSAFQALGLGAVADWRTASLACAALAVALTAALAPAVLSPPWATPAESGEACEELTGPATEGQSQAPAGAVPSALGVLLSGQFALMAINVMGLTCLLELSQMLPLYAAQVWHVPASATIWSSALYPAGSVASTLLGGWLVDTVGSSNRSRVAGGFLLGTVATVAGFIALTAAAGDGNSSASLDSLSTGGLAALLLTLSAGFFSSFPYYVPAALFCSGSGPNAGAVSSVLDGVAYLGSALLSKAVIVPLLQAGQGAGGQDELGVVAETLLAMGVPVGWMGAFTVLGVATTASLLAITAFYSRWV